MNCKTMASFLGFYFVTLIILAITTFAPVTAAEELAVGGAAGWRLPGANETEMYSHWAATRRFRIGDSLRFEYKNDSVVVVDKWGYYHCNASHPISVYNTGNTIINIEKPGPMYFVSGDHEHCKNGQRVLVEVIRAHQDSPAPSPLSSAASSSVFSNLVILYIVLITASSIM